MKANLQFSAFMLSVFLLTSCSTTSTHENPAQFIQSGGITIAVKSVLAADPDINSLMISVNTYKSIVTLGGYIDTFTEAHQAIHLARQVNGVQGVVDNMIVRPATDDEPLF